MTNFEYYAKNDAEHFSDFLSTHVGLAVCLDKNKETLKACQATNCSDCLFNSTNCKDGRKKWLLSEYKGNTETSDNNEGGISW